MLIGPFRKKQAFLLRLSLLAALLATGCAATPERLHPDFQGRIHPIKTLYLMPTDALVYQRVTHDDVRPDADLSREVGNQLARQVAEQFQRKRYRVLALDPGSDRREVADIMALYRAVNKSIQLHTYGPSIFPVKRDRFKYSVGTLDRFLSRKGADGLLFARVRDRNTPGRYRTYVSLAVADAKGDILWYSAGGTKSAAEFRKNEPTETLVQALLHSLPEAGP